MKLRLPGLRVIKTCLSVYICLLIDFLRGEGTPFYSAIAAILCIQKDMTKSIEIGKNRFIATIIGCIFGSLYLFIEQELISINHELIRILVLSLLLIPVIYFSVYIKQPTATYLACVVFLSVTINHANETPLTFALNRFIDTSIGIIVALVINYLLFKLENLRHKNKI